MRTQAKRIDGWLERIEEMLRVVLRIDRNGDRLAEIACDIDKRAIVKWKLDHARQVGYW